MPAKNLTRISAEGTYSHIYNKGIENRVIFGNSEDYAVFLGFIKDYLTPPQDIENVKKEFKVNGKIFRGVPHQPKNYYDQVELVAYSLLPEHFHLVLHQKKQGSLERFIRSLCTRYSIYFNKKYQRSGTLFQGPYRSVHIKDELDLLYLTRYLHLHSAGDYSSYPEYLGINKTLPVNSEIVLSNLKNGLNDYRVFVEKYHLDSSEHGLLTKISIEPVSEDLERSHLSSKFKDFAIKVETEDVVPSDSSTINSQENTEEPALENLSEPSRVEPISNTLPNATDKPTKQVYKHHHRIPEFFGATAIFILLVAIGLTNINGSNTRAELLASANTPASPAVLAEKTEAIPELETEIVVEATTGAVPKELVNVKLDDGSASVNIRQKPTSYSLKIGEAKDGDTFEFVSVDAGWYSVKLPDGQTGFIVATYIDRKKGEVQK